MFKRRSEIQIIGEILDLSKRGAKKTEILYRSNMSYSQLEHYLSFLLEKNIVEENFILNEKAKPTMIFVTTEKGNKLLDDIINL
ncbi:MAG: hypothetical protein JSW60_07965, partial [Thermoplasmatales archaeon]